MKSFKGIEEEYLFNNCTKEDFNDYYKYNSTEFIDDVKKVIIENLDAIDTRIILIYAHFGNMRAVAKELDVSLGTVYKRIKSIQQKIKDNL